MTRAPLLLIPLVALGFAVAGCGGGSDSTKGGFETTTSATTTEATTGATTEATTHVGAQGRRFNEGLPRVRRVEPEVLGGTERGCELAESREGGRRS